MLNVLVADDSKIMRRNIVAVIESMGHCVIAQAMNGKDAVSKYRKYRPDVVTMDVSMPEMNGIEAVKEIKKRFPEAVIVMSTSQGQETLVMEAIKRGVKGYVLKPVTKEKLRAVFEKLFSMESFDVIEKKDEDEEEESSEELS